tara:strand:- start:443 stop:958 length:516 start_codon:yes stop_codon:yes gene_type:complete
MKTIIKISTDYNSDLCYQSKVEDISYIVNEINVFCKLKNTNYINIIEKQKRYSSSENDYSNKVIINAKGYSQSDWQDYTLYYNEKEIDTPQKRIYFSDLVKYLERSFTHQNDYFVEKYEQTEIKGKIFNSEPIDYTSFFINHIEFPSNEDILNEYVEIYGKDFEEYIIEIE